MLTSLSLSLSTKGEERALISLKAAPGKAKWGFSLSLPCEASELQSDFFLLVVSDISTLWCELNRGHA